MPLFLPLLPPNKTYASIGLTCFLVSKGNFCFLAPCLCSCCFFPGECPLPFQDHLKCHCLPQSHSWFPSHPLPPLILPNLWLVPLSLFYGVCDLLSYDVIYIEVSSLLIDYKFFEDRWYLIHHFIHSPTLPNASMVYLFECRRYLVDTCGKCGYRCHSLASGSVGIWSLLYMGWPQITLTVNVNMEGLLLQFDMLKYENSERLAVEKWCDSFIVGNSWHQTLFIQ